MRADYERTGGSFCSQSQESIVILPSFVKTRLRVLHSGFESALAITVAKLRQVFTDFFSNVMMFLYVIIEVIRMSQLIYLADDEKNIRELIAMFLKQDGYDVETFPDGDSLAIACENNLPDLVILDIMMPGTDGLIICSQLRQKNPNLPIIIVSAKDSPMDRVTGLTLGSDDYMIKPFLPLELVVRVKALLRRSKKDSETNGIENSQAKETELEFGNLRLSVKMRKATLDGEELSLTPAEFDFLSYLMLHKERAVSRDELLSHVWKTDWQSDSRVTDDLVKRLRKKLRDRKCNVKIDTVWGYGFRLSIEDE